MINYDALFDFFRSCPQLAELKAISAAANCGGGVILPQGASPVFRYEERGDSLGGCSFAAIPLPFVYADFRINCYERLDSFADPLGNVNVLSYAQACSVCDWVADMSARRVFPDVGERVVSLECVPFVPQIAFLDPDEALACYFITVRVRFVNRALPYFFESAGR